MENLITEQHITTAIQAVDAAREITLKYFRKPFDTLQKSDSSPVTIADKETERLIRKIIQDVFPEHGFYGEETGQTDIDRDWTWVVDPIDGTASFATGKPTFGTLVALCYKGVPQLGIIDHAVLNDRWIGIKGKQTTYNGNTVKTNSDSTDLSNATLYATSLEMYNESALPRYQKLAKQCKFRIFGADCLAFGLVASGFTEMVMEAQLEPYDYMALVPVIEGAGGIITDWQGNCVALQTTKDQILACANSELHNAALAIINS